MSFSATSTATMVVEQPKQLPKQATLKVEHDQFPDIQTIRDAIPAHCFESSLWTGFYYVFRDLTMVSALAWAALTYIPAIPDPIYRTAAWIAYGYVQGLFCTGVWILGHECGHGSFSKYRAVNDFVGWALHSFLLVPFFSWKFSHHRHHRFHNHIEKDMVFAPMTVARKQEIEQQKQKTEAALSTLDLHEMVEDTPLSQMAKLLAHQLFGWQSYLFLNASAGKGSAQREAKGLDAWFRVSHFDPFSAVFRPSEAKYIFYSDVGLAITLGCLYMAAQVVGTSTVLLLYAVPYLWVHHWLVAITYLHHTHPDLPHYTEEGWSYVKGALSTVDRDFGFIGKHIFHGIIEKHVVHHLFTRIPFYHADEATEAIKPILGDRYTLDNRSFLGQLWQAFTTLRYVEHDPAHPGALRWVKTKK
ncbi:hypothetical protein SODALDRAFT_340537 [Sodiomyces alkalinus F11]|uniref:Fatty acid desaturase domain-containing protein n=1 Tax=Sodiomyces alkalinus (strain CBS 110278 / VKM F-3762 / F11) TaxID=1314773 RepID=A0A3N2PRS8_SODAK|nr:hypothetical protein SODALDRAFT_340537 [Sodiomyces alkalinus F11]ROT37134.1 hypothetical protein SODALDRAFT_340537 [Sodiomyces alkalinus F11]